MAVPGMPGAGLLLILVEPFSNACAYGPSDMNSTRSPLLPWFSKRSCNNFTRFRTNCKEKGEAAELGGSSSSSSSRMEDWVSSASASPYQILGVDPTSCSPAQLKTAFRARVKEFHPDVCKDMRDSESIIRRVIQAYEMLSKYHQAETTKRECVDPFEEPECEAYDVFVNEVLCLGKGCPYSCVKRAPQAFSFTSQYGTARAISQGHGEDYLVQLAVGQCPRRCINYVTPSQRAVLEDLLQNILDAPYDSAESALLDCLISKAMFENNRYQKPKRQPKVSTEYVDWS